MTGKVKTKQAVISFLAKGSFAFRKVDAQRKEWLRENEELSLWLEIQQQLKGVSNLFPSQLLLRWKHFCRCTVSRSPLSSKIVNKGDYLIKDGNRSFGYREGKKNKKGK